MFNLLGCVKKNGTEDLMLNWYQLSAIEKTVAVKIKFVKK